MNQIPGPFFIIFGCMLVLLVGAIRGKAEWLLDIVMRSVLGTLAILFINMLLGNLGISVGVGINAVTVLTSGILGFPGLVVLYGLGIYKLL